MRRREATALLAGSGTAVVLAVLVAMFLRHRPQAVWFDLFLWHNGPAAVVLLWTGHLVLHRRSGHAAGRVLVAIGGLFAVHVAVAFALDVRLVASGFPGRIHDPPLADLPQAALPLDIATMGWITGWWWALPVILTVVVLPLLFPDGHLPRHGRVVLAVGGAGAALIVAALAVLSWPTATWLDPDAPPVVWTVLAAGGLTLAVATVAALTVMVQRGQRAAPEQRGPYRLVGGAVAVLAAGGILTYPWWQVWTIVVLVGSNLLFVAYGLAVARYRLHDVEPLIGRAAVPAAVGATVAAAYLAVTVGLARVVGERTDEIVFAVLAAALAGLLVEPVRRITRTLTERLVHRRHADRTEVLSRLARGAVAEPTARLLAEVAQLLLRSTGARRAEVCLGSGDAAVPAATAGTVADRDPVRTAPIADAAGQLGELRLYAWTTADLVPDAGRLLSDVAHTLATVLRRDELDASLRTHVEQLRASRQRLVTEHDRARRGLERDIHDGAQSRLIALRLRVAALRTRVIDTATTTELDAIAREVDAAVRSLRELARGVYPPPLEQAGLVAALREGTHDLSIPVDITATGLGRYPSAVEAGAYFACLEAVQNAVRHSDADRVEVALDGDAAALRFRVLDRGRGFDTRRGYAGTGLSNIGDRIAALGGAARVLSTPGRGTEVVGEIPVQPSDSAR